MAAREPDGRVRRHRGRSGGGLVLGRLARSGAAGGGARLLDAGGRSQRQSVAALHHAGGALAAARDARKRRSAFPGDAARLRGQAVQCASWRRSARARPRLLAAARQRPRRLRRVHAYDAGGAPARAARRAHVCGQAAPDGACDRDRAQPEQGRDPCPLSQPRALRRQSRRRARGSARLFRQGAAPLDLGRGGLAGGLAAIARATPAGSLHRGRAQCPRPRARSRRRRRHPAFGRGRAGEA